VRNPWSLEEPCTKFNRKITAERILQSTRCNIGRHSWSFQFRSNTVSTNREQMTQRRAKSDDTHRQCPGTASAAAALCLHGDTEGGSTWRSGNELCCAGMWDLGISMRSSRTWPGAIAHRRERERERVKDQKRQPEGESSQSKFLYKNWPMSWVQTPNPKSYNKVMNTPTNIIEMIPSKIWTQRKKSGINWTSG
jgi:hypothetical protein